MPVAPRRQPFPPSAASELFRWWRAELRDLLAGVSRRKAPVRMVAPADVTVMRGGVLLGAGMAGPVAIAGLRERAIEVFGGKGLPRSVNVTLAEGRFLRRKLADNRIPLGRAQAMAELDVETQTPFRLGDVYILFAEPLPSDQGTHYFLVRRDALDPLLDAVQGARCRLGALAFEEDGMIRPACDFAVEGLASGPGPLFRNARKYAFGLGCAALLAATGYNISAAFADALSSADAAIEALEPRAVAARRAFKARADFLDRVEAIHAEHSAYMPVSRLVEELSYVLPDTTYLTSLSVRQGRVKIAGFSEDAAALIALVEESKVFDNPRFLSAVAKAPDRNGEQFDLEAEVEHAR